MEAAIISGVTALIVTFVASLLSRRREREADWRKLKLGYFCEYLDALSGIASEEARTAENLARHAKAFNNLLLVGSSSVMDALDYWHKEIVLRNETPSRERHDRRFIALLSAIRRDLGQPNDTLMNRTLGLLAPPSTAGRTARQHVLPDTVGSAHPHAAKPLRVDVGDSPRF